MTENNANPAGQEGTEELLQIPPTVMVSCPLVPGILRRMERCVDCEHGARPLLLDRFGPGSNHPFAVRYLLRCKHPRSLPLTEVEA